MNSLCLECVFRTKKNKLPLMTSRLSIRDTGSTPAPSQIFRVNQSVEMLAVNCPVIQLFTHADPYQSMLCVRSYTDYFFNMHHELFA